MHRRNTLAGRTAVLTTALAVVAALSACTPPSYRFTASDADDLAVKVPRSWALVKSGVPPASDGTAGEAGNWYAVYDAAARPSADHFDSRHAVAPVAMVRSLVVTAEQGQSLTADDLRDLYVPVTPQGRAESGAPELTGAGFRLLEDAPLATRTSQGVHVVASYDLGEGAEVFDKVVVTDKRRTRVHVLVVHCSQSCYDSNRRSIADTVRSFTVRNP